MAVELFGAENSNQQQQQQNISENKYVKPVIGYYSGINELPEGNRKISPSGLGGFFNDSAEWYRRNIEKSDLFEGNTSSVTGTIVHHLAECYVSGSEPDYEMIEKYLEEHIDNKDVDLDEVRSLYPVMYEALEREYLSKMSEPIEIEKFLHYELVPGFSVGGSVDRLEPRTVVDYKTVGKKPTGLKTYRLQLLVYAWLYTKIGVPIDTIKVVAIQRPTKTLPSRVWVLEEIITEADLMYIETMMKTLASCIKMAQDNFLMKDLLFRENPMSMFAKDSTPVKLASEVLDNGSY